MATSNEQKAQQLIAEAQKKLNSSQSFLGSLFRGSQKVEEAIECYQRAGNLFKMSKNWSKAGGAFSEAANLHSKMSSRHDAAINYVNASNCYKKSDIDEAVKYLVHAIEIYTDMGRFTMAAKHHQNIAEIYETSDVNLEQVVSHYEQAADYYRGEENNSLANKCLLKVAEYTAQLENYEKAIPIYQQVASSCLESSLLKYSVNDYFLKAGLCHLCIDILNAQNAIKRYIELYPAFQDSRECKLIQTLIEHIEEQNVEGFTEAVKSYDSISRLNKWFTMVLLRIKKTIKDNPDLR